MGGKLRITREWESCCSIVSLLLLLAHLAERAAGAPDPVRMGLMWALRGAVEVAGSFAVRPTLSARPRLAFVAGLPEDTGSGAVDALNLAPALRALAVVVHAMAAHLRKQATCSPTLRHAEVRLPGPRRPHPPDIVLCGRRSSTRPEPSVTPGNAVRPSRAPIARRQRSRAPGDRCRAGPLPFAARKDGMRPPPLILARPK